MRKFKGNAYLSFGLIFLIATFLNLSLIQTSGLIERTTLSYKQFDNSSKKDINESVTPLAESEETEDDFIYLSDIPYVANQSKPGYGTISLDKVDSNTNLSLRINGSVLSFKKGIFAHATSTLVYDLKDYNYDYFTTYYGVSSYRGNNGSVKFLFYTSMDGSNWDLESDEEPSVLTGGSNAGFIKVNIKGKRYLKLYADANGSNAQDHSLYGDAKLIKESYNENVTKSVEEYDKLINEKYSNGEITDELELLILQRNIVSNMGNFQIKSLFEDGESYKNTFNWLMNDLEMLRLYVNGGKPDGSYYQSFKVLNDLYANYSDDLTVEGTTFNGVKLSDVYKKMMISIALTHSQTVSFWITSSVPDGEEVPSPNPNISDPVVRYQTFKDMLNKGKLNNSIFEQLEVEEMRFIMASFINNDEIEWARDYIINSGKNWRSAYQFMSYKNVNTGLYRNDIYYGENRKNFEDKYKLTGHDVKNIKYYPRLWHILEVGGVCWQISNVGQNLATSYGVPSVMLGQPGHVMYVVYELDSNGNGWWSNWNDVGGWSTINAYNAYSGHKSYFAVRLINGWGTAPYVTRNMSGNYLFLGQEAINDYDNYVKANERVLLANSYDNNEFKEKRYREALEYQSINLDAWLGLINLYIGDSSKNDEDLFALASEVANGLKYHPLPMYDLLNLINDNVKSIAYSAKITALQEETLKIAANITNNESSQYGAIKTVANTLLGRIETEVARFSFDGEEAGVLALSKKYEFSNALWDYSLDGGKTWTVVTEKSKKLSDEEIASINVDDDILVHIIGVNYSQDNIFKIDIGKSVLPENLYGNDLENKVIAATDKMEWRLDPSSDWISYKEKNPDLGGDKNVEVRVGATGTNVASDSQKYKFTQDLVDSKNVYVPIEHLSIHSFSSENVRANKKEFEYALNAIDGNINTSWHTSRVSTTDKKYIVIKLDSARYISSIEYIPRQNYYYGIPKDIKVYSSSDGKNWIEVASDTFKKDFNLKKIKLARKVPAEYIKIQATTSYDPGNSNKNYFMNAAMINIFEDVSSTMPTADVEYDINEKTAKPVTAKLVNPSGKITILNNDGRDSYTFNENGSFKFVFVDENGNEGYKEASVDWISDYDFSLDGDDAGKIIISSKYLSDNLKWKYSIDGGNNWKDAKGVEQQLTIEELAGLSSSNDIKIHILTSNDLSNVEHTIDLLESESLPVEIFANDFENKIFGVTEDIEWHIIGDDNWTLYKDAIPNLKGNTQVEIRRRAHGTTLSSSVRLFEFTNDYEEDDKKRYVSIDRLSVEAFSSETVRPERNQFEYATNAIDGNNNTKWHTSRVATNDEKYIVLKLNAPSHISMIQWVPEKNYDYGLIKDAIVYSSMDGVTWKEIGNVTNNPKSYDCLNIELDSSDVAKYIKVQAPQTYPTNNSNKGYFLSVSSINLFEDITNRVPTYVDIEYSTTSSTSDDVVATIVSNKKITVTNNDGKNTYTFTKNGSFTFNYVDEDGVEGSVEANVSWIDKQHVFEIVYSTKEKTNQDVVATLNLPDGYRIVNDGPNTHTFTENGDYTFEYINGEGHTGFIIASVDWINKEIEQLQVKYSTRDKTNKNVVATLELPEGYAIANNGKNTYTFTKNGSHIFYYKDAYGNTSSAIAAVDWINKEIEELNVTYNITSITNKDVVATLVLKDGIKVTNNDGKNTYTFIENGEFTFLYEDEYGNISSSTATVNWIKKDKPMLEVTYDIKDKTNKDVVATLVLKDGIKVTNNKGKNTYTFTENGEFTFEYVDSYGNKGKTKAKVTWINKNKPVLEVTYDIKDKTNKDVVATLVLKDGIKVTNNGGKNTYTFTKNGEFSFLYKDEYGNEGSTTAKTDWIDKVAPTASLEYSITECTNKDVIVTLIPNEKIIVSNNNGKLKYTFTKNGTFIFTFVDEAGNTGKAEAKVDWINKDIPKLNISYDIDDLTNKNVTATLELKDGITVTNNNGKNTYTFKDNGSFTFIYEDQHGNRGTTIAKVDWIDKVAPTATLEYSVTQLTDKPVIVTLVPNEDVTIVNNSGKKTYIFESNGLFKFELIDKAGNVGSIVAKVDWIKNKPKELNVTYDISSKTDKSVVATLELEDGFKILNNNGKNTYTFVTNGTFEFKYEDKDGNEGSSFARVDWIDEEKLVVEVEYDVTEVTAGDVVASIRANKNIKITNNNGKNTYRFCENGKFVFNYEDEYGNTGSIEAEVSWINKNVPYLNVEYDITNKTNKDVVATLKLVDGIKIVNNEGKNTYKFEKNGLFTFIYEDQHGNRGTTVAKVDWIDKVAPTATLEYDTTDFTNQNVNVTLSSNEKITVINNEGKNTYTFTENGTFIFKFVDEAGNEGEIEAKVEWINKNIPKLSVSYNITKPTRNTVTAILEVNDDITVTNNKGRTIYEFAKNGEFVFEYVDKYGNKGTSIAKVDWIIEEDLKVNISYDISTITNSNVVATINSNQPIIMVNNEGKKSYTFTENGEFLFKYRDIDGYEHTLKSKVDWIDKIGPSAAFKYDITNKTDKNVVVTIKPSEDITITNNNGKTTYIFTKNGMFTFEFVDKAGNKGSATAHVDWIDEEELIVKVEYDVTETTPGDVIAIIKANKNIKIINNNGKNTYKFRENGKFVFKYEDEYGNTGSIEAEVTWINKKVPKLDVVYDKINKTNKDVVATLKLVDGIKIINNNGKNTYTFEKNGSFKFIYEDQHGNRGIAIAKVDWIDKVIPSGKIKYNITQTTSNKVIATLVTNEDVKILNNNGKKSYTFVDNGEFTFKIIDDAGNVSSVTAKVNWIVKAPIIDKNNSINNNFVSTNDNKNNNSKKEDNNLVNESNNVEFIDGDVKVEAISTELSDKYSLSIVRFNLTDEINKKIPGIKDCFKLGLKDLKGEDVDVSSEEFKISLPIKSTVDILCVYRIIGDSTIEEIDNYIIKDGKVEFEVNNLDSYVISYEDEIDDTIENNLNINWKLIVGIVISCIVIYLSCKNDKEKKESD